MNRLKLIVFVLLFSPTLTYGNELCPKAESTREISDCLISLNEKASQQMKKYLEAAIHRYKTDSTLINQINSSQKKWNAYKVEHCDAVYQMWTEGSMRLIAQPTCLLYTTKQRTYDIWREFLTYGDSTKPVLPEPKLLLYSK